MYTWSKFQLSSTFLVKLYSKNVFSLNLTEFSSIQIIDSKSVGSLLFTHYKLAIELISTLLLAAMVAVIYFAKNIEKNEAE